MNMYIQRDSDSSVESFPNHDQDETFNSCFSNLSQALERRDRLSTEHSEGKVRSRSPKDNPHNSCAADKVLAKAKNKKSVRFKPDSQLVNIREIPPRPNRSDSESETDSDVDEEETESSDESEDDSSDSSSTSSDSLPKSFNKLNIKHPKRHKAHPPPRRHKHTSSNRSSTRNNASCRQLKGKSAPREPKRKPLPTKSLPVFHQRRFGRTITSGRPGSNTGSTTQSNSNSASLTSRSRSAPASLNCRTPPLLSVGSRRFVQAALTSQNSAYGMDVNFRERAKHFAWQAANNGATTVLNTPCIAPMYTEQVTVTKLS